MRGEERLKQSSFVDEVAGFLKKKSSMKKRRREEEGVGKYVCMVTS